MKINKDTFRKLSGLSQLMYSTTEYNSYSVLNGISLIQSCPKCAKVCAATITTTNNNVILYL